MDTLPNNDGGSEFTKRRSRSRSAVGFRPKGSSSTVSVEADSAVVATVSCGRLLSVDATGASVQPADQRGTATTSGALLTFDSCESSAKVGRVAKGGKRKARPLALGVR